MKVSEILRQPYCYIGTGHGWNDEHTKLIKAEGLDYARNNFRLALLEYRPILERGISFERQIWL